MKSPYKVRYKPAKRTPERLKVLALLVFFSLILYGFIYAFILRDPIISKAPKPQGPYPDLFVEDLGLTPDQLKEKYPELFLSHNRYGVLVGKHVLEGAHYYIWFVAENGQNIAFRLKAVKELPQQEEKSLLAYFGQLYGRPFDAHCSGKTASAVDKCLYKWWVRKSVSLDVHSRLTSDERFILSAITTDTYLSTKHHQKIKSVLPIQ